jgi:predicted nuclease of predicted toxin-antitoxin system
MGVRFYLDQNVTPRVSAAARRLGLDVTDWQEAGMENASDEEQLAYATEQRRAIVSCDVEDFVDLARRWTEEERRHAGIVCVTRQISADDSGAVARALLRLNDAHAGTSSEDALLWLSFADDQ